MVRHSLYKFSVKLVDFLLASMLSTVIASYAFSQNITGRVESIRPNFFLNISTDYDLFNCRFNTDDAEDLWLLCDLRAKNDDKSAFAWLLPRQKDGVWGEPLILDREVHDGKQFSQVLRIISAKEFLVDYVDGYSTIVKVGVDIKARSLYKRLLPNWYYPISKAIHEGWKITQVQFDRNGYIVLLNKTNLYVNIYGNKKPLEVFRVISIDDRGRENWIYNFERQIEVDSLNSELDPIQVIYDAASISKKSLFITADDKVVVYGTTGGYKTSSLAADGTLVVCLQTNGKELHRVFWKNAYWSHPIAWHVLSGSEN
ncbi:MAG: hypothetical protein JNK86_06780, partial [Alphaproteobacteria bacterium]|nr:hypothetical protein [Alphaproteobacteria bacterium]